MRYLFFLLLSLPALSQEPLKYPLLKKTIDSLALIDQKVHGLTTVYWRFS